MFLSVGIEYITGDNFLDMLDNGVILCQLARVIHERAQHAYNNGLFKGVSWNFCVFSFRKKIPSNLDQVILVCVVSPSQFILNSFLHSY